MTVLMAGTVLTCRECGERAPLRTNGAPDTVYEGQFHQCRALRGMLAPLRPEGESYKVEVHEPLDYESDAYLQHGDDGRPVMSVETTRADGNDIIAFAPMIKLGRQS